MKKTFLMLALTLVSALCFANGFVICENGEAKSTVILPENATPAQKYAAEEFISYIEKISDAKLPTSPTPTGNNDIFIGKTDETVKLMKGFDWKQIKRDGIFFRCNGKNRLVIAGDDRAGEIYAVYSFLEDCLGVKYYLSDEEYIPKKPTIIIDKFEHKYSPKIISRESYYKEMYKNKPTYALKLKQNGHGLSKMPKEYGGNVTLVGFAHTFSGLMNPNDYGEEHPEWFSYRNGKRILDERLTQPCLTNGEMVKQLIRNVFKEIEKHPDEKIFSCTQYDNNNYCECENCKKAAEKLGQSGLLLTVINQIAEEVAKVYPDIYIETFAYHYTQRAPISKDIKPLDNVIIRLCSIEADFSRPFDDPSNKVFMKDLTDWAKISKQLYIWDYSINYPNHLMPFPNVQVLQKNMQILAKNKAIAIFSEGDEANRNAWLIRYKGYIIAKLCWNPNIDFDRETKGFCKFYYGDAGDDMYNYIKLTEKQMKDTAERLKDKLYVRENFTSVDYLTYEQWREQFDLVAKALDKVKGNEKYYDRVYDDYLGVIAGIMCAPRDIYLKIVADNVLPFDNSIDLMDEYMKRKDAREMPSPAEHFVWNNHFDGYLTKNKTGIPPKECEGLKPTEWVDMKPLIPYMGYKLPDSMVKQTDDPTAPNGGKVLWHTTSSKDWYYMPPLVYLFANPHKYADVYMTYRIEQDKEYSKDAVHTGVYSHKTKYAFNTHLPSDRTPDNKYITEKIGTIDLDETGNDAYFYIAGNGVPNATKGIFVDRVFFIYRD